MQYIELKIVGKKTAVRIGLLLKGGERDTLKFITDHRLKSDYKIAYEPDNEFYYSIIPYDSTEL